jgi:hypothetical protein
MKLQVHRNPGVPSRAKRGSINISNDMQISKVISTTLGPKTQSARFSRIIGTVDHRKRNDIRIQTRTIARENEEYESFMYPCAVS